MKILNISASILSFVLLSSLSFASNLPNDELGEASADRTAPTTQTTPPVATETQDPTRYPIEWPQKGSSAKFWKQYWNAQIVTLGLFNRGTNNILGVFTGNFKEEKNGEPFYTPLTVKDRLSSLAAGPAEIILAPVAGLLLFSVSYCKSDENGEWVSSFKPGGPQSEQPSAESNFFGSIFNLFTLPANLVDRVANKNK